MHNILDESELELLQDFLEKIESPFNLESLDGFFTALICGPDMIMPSQFLPVIIADYSFENETDCEQFINLLMGYWNSVSRELKLASESYDFDYEPFLYEYDDVGVTANIWAVGFMTGVSMGAEGWETLILDDPESPMMPIIFLANEMQPDFPEDIKIPEALRESIIGNLGLSILVIYDYFADQRANVRPQRKRKTGRNDPCPCGSGKKFKLCCAGKLRSIN